jgi:hypothetical protein
MLEGSKFAYAARGAALVAAFQAMTADQKEFFMLMLPNWYFSVEELMETAKLLSD